MMAEEERRRGRKREREIMADERGAAARARGGHSQQQLLLVPLEDLADVLEDGGREQVDAAVNDLANERAGLLHVVQDLGVGPREHCALATPRGGGPAPGRTRPRPKAHPVPRACRRWPRCSRSSGTASCWPAERGRISAGAAGPRSPDAQAPAHRGAKDDEGGRAAALPLEGEHLGQRELGAHVRVEHEESLGAARQDLVAEVIEAPARAQRRVLLQVPAGRARAPRPGELPPAWTRQAGARHPSASGERRP